MTSTLEKQEKYTTGETGQVVIRFFNPMHKGLYVRPHKDPSTGSINNGNPNHTFICKQIPIEGSPGAYLDIWEFNENSRKHKDEYVLMPGNEFCITHAMILDKEKPLGFALYNWFKTLSAYSESKDEQYEGKYFYYEDIEKESEISIASVEKEIEAKSFVMKLSEEDIIDLSKMYGLHSTGISINVLKSKLYAIATNKPQELLDKWNNPHKKLLVLFDDLIKNEIVKLHDESGEYIYNETPIGKDSIEFIVWASEKTNVNTLNVLHTKVKKSKEADKLPKN